MAETVLLVEDDPSLRRLSQRLLAKLGYNVIVAANGESATASCRDSPDPIELLVTDVFMPDIDGPALAEQLLVMRPQMKVLFVSGSNETLTDAQLRQGGANFLQKPFTTDEFSRKIREILDR